MATGMQIEDREGVRVLRMQFGSANAIGPATAEAIIGALQQDDRPTVLTGEGTIFSAGLNLRELEDYDREAMQAFVRRFSVLMTQALTTPFPLIAAVNGHAVAGGCVLAMACDERIGVEGRYKIGMNEMAIGLTLPAVVTEILRGKLSPEHARTVILGGALYAPEDAVAVGLLDELAKDAEAAVDKACDVARRLGRAGAEFSAMKGSLVSPIVAHFRETREALDHRFIESWFNETASHSRAEALARMRSPADA